EDGEEAEDGEDLAVLSRPEVVTDNGLQEQSKDACDPSPACRHRVVCDELAPFAFSGTARDHMTVSHAAGPTHLTPCDRRAHGHLVTARRHTTPILPTMFRSSPAPLTNSTRNGSNVPISATAHAPA